MRAGSSSTLASASRSVSFLALPPMICGRCSRTFFTSTWMPARRCSISALRLAPLALRRGSLPGQVEAGHQLGGDHVHVLLGGSHDPGQRSTSTGLS